ncbi:MAG: diguanylate cyclase [Achromobacter sp.]|uniref:GGDEF domain-containing protein n=1 Tax=Achromobacter sp. TaxID=134375 RepID=UPI003CFD424D
MVASVVILGMLCVHLLCFCAMFLLISTRLGGKKMGTDVFAAGHLLLGVAYILQLLAAAPGPGAMNFINHTLTLCAPFAYALGAVRFFNRPIPVLYPMLALAILYTATQALVQAAWGTQARHALLAAACALLFLAMTLGLLYGARTFARDLRLEMIVFAILVGGICGLNAAKFMLILDGGLPALDMQSRFQTVFYIYMSFLGTVLPPAVVWLILRRLTDELRTMATRDPLTGLLNRRGLMDGLQAHFRQRDIGYAHLLIVDIDRFKQINDTYGHQNGDLILCRVAQVLQDTVRQGDLVCRLGGEEFVVVALNSDRDGAMRLAERLRAAIAQSQVPGGRQHGPIRCTATIGVSRPFAGTQAFDDTMQQADAALYRGKMSGRNRVEGADEATATPMVAQASA